jgi:signal transduction histidine kinase/F0F1-type ATP synthase epsilon subunit
MDKENVRLQEKVFYFERELEGLEESMISEARVVAQNNAVINLLTSKSPQIKKEEQKRIFSHFEKNIFEKNKLISEVKLNILDKKGNYLGNGSFIHNEKENISKVLGSKNEYPQKVVDYIYDGIGGFVVKAYAPVYDFQLKEVIGAVVISYKFDRYIFDRLKKIYSVDIILENNYGEYILSTFDSLLKQEYFKGDKLEFDNNLFLIKKIKIKSLDMNFILAFNKGDILRERSELSSYLFVSLFFVFSLLFIVSSTVLNIFIDSLKSLTMKINTLKDGNFNVNLGSLKNNNDEIGILAHDFENMVHILKNKIRELEEANLNNKHYSSRLEKANEALKSSQENIKEKSENIERINKLLNNRITEISNMYYLMVNVSKHMLDEKFYEVIVKGVREGLLLPKVALYLTDDFNEKTVLLKKNLGFETTESKINMEGIDLVLTKKEVLDAEEVLNTASFGYLENVYIFPMVSRRENDRFYGILMISNGEKLKQEFKKSVLTYVNALLLAIENRKLYLELLKENKKLEETTKELQESEKMKNIFISNISHELRIPLVPIKGYHEIILEEHMGTLTPKQRSAMKTSLKNIERLQEIIENILNYSRIESGKYQILNTVLNVEEVLNDVFVRLDNMIETKKIEVVKEYSVENAYIYGDREALKQIFINLISNSIKFSDDSGVRIIIGISQEGEKYRISVKDDGVGMDRSQIEQVLKSFRQLDEGNTRRYRGLGLGLTVADKILAYYGEKLYINSKKKEGTEVYFYFKKGEGFNEIGINV